MRNKKVYLVVTIDTEADSDIFWRKSNPLSFLSVTKGIPELLHPLFKRFGVRPTYLISPEVLEDFRCVNSLLSLGGDYELGTHLHPEYIEPEKKYESYAGTSSSDFPCFDYEKDVEFNKLRNLTNLFEEKTGKRPFSYRAGRFGADGDTIEALEKLGYLVDSSVTPNLSWRSKGGPDFRFAPKQPYFPDKRDISRYGNSKILEVPVTMGGSKKFFFFLSHWFCYLALIPTSNSVRSMITLINQYINDFQDNKYIILNMMFHSMELIPKATPYNRSKKAVAKFLNRLGGVFDYCNSINVDFLTLMDVYKLFMEKTDD